LTPSGLQKRSGGSADCDRRSAYGDPGGTGTAHLATGPSAGAATGRVFGFFNDGCALRFIVPAQTAPRSSLPCKTVRDTDAIAWWTNYRKIGQAEKARIRAKRRWSAELQHQFETSVRLMHSRAVRGPAFACGPESSFAFGSRVRHFPPPTQSPAPRAAQSSAPQAGPGVPGSARRPGPSVLQSTIACAQSPGSPCGPASGFTRGPKPGSACGPASGFTCVPKPGSACGLSVRLHPRPQKARLRLRQRPLHLRPKARLRLRPRRPGFTPQPKARVSPAAQSPVSPAAQSPGIRRQAKSGFAGRAKCCPSTARPR